MRSWRPGKICAADRPRGCMKRPLPSGSSSVSADRARQEIMQLSCYEKPWLACDTWDEAERERPLLALGGEQRAEAEHRPCGLGAYTGICRHGEEVGWEIEKGSQARCTSARAGSAGFPFDSQGSLETKILSMQSKSNAAWLQVRLLRQRYLSVGVGLIRGAPQLSRYYQSPGVFVDRKESNIEKRVKISPQEQSVLWVICNWTAIWDDMGRFEGLGTIIASNSASASI